MAHPFPPGRPRNKKHWNTAKDDAAKDPDYDPAAEEPDEWSGQSEDEDEKVIIETCKL